MIHFIQSEEKLISNLNNIITSEFFRISELGICEFGYRKFLKTGLTYGFCTKDDWNKFLQKNPDFTEEMNIHYENELYDVTFSDKKYFMRTGEQKEINSTFLKALYQHGLWNTLAYYRKTDDGIEGFYFISSCKSYHVIANYINNLNIIENFSKIVSEKINAIINDQQKYGFLYHEIKNQKILEILNSQPLKEKIKKDIFNSGASFNLEGKKYNFSKRELETLILIREGFSYKEIGSKLGISSKTVESYVANAKSKTGSNTRSQIIQFANQAHLKTILN